MARRPCRENGEKTGSNRAALVAGAPVCNENRRDQHCYENGHTVDLETYILFMAMVMAMS